MSTVRIAENKGTRKLGHSVDKGAWDLVDTRE